MSDTKFRVLVYCFRKYSIDVLQILKDKPILVVVERLSIKRSVLSNSEVFRRVSSVKLIWHDEFLWFVVNPTGIVTAVILKLLVTMAEIASTATKVLRALFC